MPQVVFTSTPKRDVTPPNPVPTFRLTATPDLKGIQPQGPAYTVLYRAATIVIGGVHLPDVRWENQPWVGQQFMSETNFNLTLVVDLHRFLIDEIESARSDDLACSLTLNFVMSKPGGQPESNGNTSEFTISEKEWTTLLGKAGYRAGWIAYIERGSVEGWSEVEKRVSEAHDRLLARDPKGVLVACREAFRVADKVVSGDWPDIAAQIDRGSKPDPPHKPKSDRVKNLKEWALNMADTGGHAEDHYNPTPEDADLVYGITVDLLSYLSRKEAHAQRARRT